MSDGAALATTWALMSLAERALARLLWALDMTGVMTALPTPRDFSSRGVSLSTLSQPMGSSRHWWSASSTRAL